MSEHFSKLALSVAGLNPLSLPRSMALLALAERPWEQLLFNGPHIGMHQPSAVLVLFIPGPTPNDPAELLLTRRSTKVRSHKGQISLAGGRRDPEDLSPAATALRELQEEVGAEKESVRVVGMLPAVHALDGSPIYPVVGVAPFKKSTLSPSADEVAAIMTVPWPCCASSQAQNFKFNIFGNWRHSWIFNTPQGNIWGLTATILYSASLA